ncbi:MAG TPA: oligosaccharide flippase family protein [Blastocatellia bacterium]|nr:oligosaccharide flippase family protein [Blastocatellia bacterium]
MRFLQELTPKTDTPPIADNDAIWGTNEAKGDLVARNFMFRYLALGVEVVLGIFLLPFNVRHLGPAAYGLLALTAALTAYFSMLDLGYGLAQEKFAAQYRALKDPDAINSVVSTLFFVFTGIGIVTFGITVALAFNLARFFNITAAQAVEARGVLLVMGAFVALNFPFSVFGGIVNGFMRNYMNGVVAIATSVIAGLVNVLVLWKGLGLLDLVIAVYLVRGVSLWFYRRNAYRVFPGLRIRPFYFRRDRLKSLTSFSVFMLVLDLANKINYSTDAMVIGAFMTAAAVAVWTVGQRLIETVQKLTNQLNGSLFPLVVDSATIGSEYRLQRILVQGTRLSLAMVIPLGTVLAVVARPLVDAWVGSRFEGTVPVIQILSVVVVIRVGNATATTLLKGVERHRLLAGLNVLMSLLNLGLSILLVHRYGLIGVAIGTLVPVALISIFVLFPVACREVGLPIRQVLRSGVWPAVWPTALMWVVLGVTGRFVGDGLILVSLRSGFGLLLYSTLFLWAAVDDADRRWYLSSAMRLVRWPAWAMTASTT